MLRHIFPAQPVFLTFIDLSNLLALPLLLAFRQERILVLAPIEGKAGQGIVKSNHHLSELTRMTFKKSDPTIITLYFKNGMVQPDQENAPRARVYHMENKERLILVLRTNMKRFR